MVAIAWKTANKLHPAQRWQPYVEGNYLSWAKNSLEIGVVSSKSIYGLFSNLRPINALLNFSKLTNRPVLVTAIGLFLAHLLINGTGALLFYPSLFHSTVGSRMSWSADSPRTRLTVAWPADQSIRVFLTQVPARRDELSRAARRLVHYTGASIAQRIIHNEEVWMRRIDTMSDWQKNRTRRDTAAAFARALAQRSRRRGC
ncbi:MAG: hypothetical protein JWP29_139 [Rhodoferax sp.]|nr:hypothetical protein [Rhodoferax sp.]